MITTKRQVETEQDRYGGYVQPVNRIGVSKIDDSQTELYSPRPRFEQGHDFSLMRGESEIQYSTRTSEGHSEYIGLKEKPAQQTYVSPLKVKNRSKEDVMPSIKKEQARYEYEVNKTNREGLSLKTKIMLSVYIAVVLVLAAAVIGTGYAITATTESVSALESEIMQKNQVIAVQEGQIAMLGDETYNTGRATEIGMVKVGEDYIEVEVVSPKAPQRYEQRTNWFDKLCDFLSKIIGG